MNILVNYIGTRGAGPVFSLEMVKGLLKNGCNITAIISEHMENYAEWKKLPIKQYVIKSYRNKWEYLFNSFFFSFRVGKYIKREFRDAEYDFLYVPMIQMWSYKINRLFPNVLHVVTVHDPEPHSSRLFSPRDIMYNSVCRKTIKSADRIIILSEIFRETIKKNYHYIDKDIVTIPHGRFSYYKNFLKKNEDIRDDKIHFLFFGRIESYKGLNLLYDAYALLEKKYAGQCDLRVVGSGDFSEYIDKYTKLNTVEIVNRWIKDEEVVGYFEKKNTVLVIPYITASQSGVIPIAMEMSCPVIATNVGGISEQIRDKETGLLCQPDANSLFTTLEYSINHWKECGEMAEKACNELENLNWDKLAGKLLDYIRDEKNKDNN
ncbi:MAG: glycosyltransferase family 4 protein [Lachnospiraceae bacterium]|nr:glycosyltransferase family 4 protein [Lachnospiraceae bacterium]